MLGSRELTYWQFFKGLNETPDSERKQSELNQFVYEKLLSIDFNNAKIRSISFRNSAVEGKDLIISELINENSGHWKGIITKIDSENLLPDLPYFQLEESETVEPEVYTAPDTMGTLLEKNSLTADALCFLIEKFVQSVDENDVDKAHMFFKVFPNFIKQYYYESDEHDKRENIAKVFAHQITLHELSLLQDYQRDFCLSIFGLGGFYERFWNYAWIKEQGKVFLEFLSDERVVRKLVDLNLNKAEVKKLCEKVDMHKARYILIKGVNSKEDLDAWNSLSEKEVEELQKIAGRRNIDQLGLSIIEIIELFKKDKYKLIRISKPQVLERMADWGREYRDILFDKDPLKYLYFSDPKTFELISSLGVSHTHRLYMDNFSAFSAMYWQGHWFLHNHVNDIYPLINLHVERKLSPVMPKFGETSGRLEFQKKIWKYNKTLRLPPPPPLPVRKESYQAMLSDSSSSSSIEL